MKKFCFLLLFSAMLSPVCRAQKINRDSLGQKVLKHVDSLGSMEGMPLKDIVHMLGRNDFNQVEMTYAIYCWIAKNVAFDTWAYNHARSANYTPSQALNTREATGLGYANLFKTMCDLARIECVVIDGTAKAHAASITQPKRLLKHHWNAVKIRDTWYYADAAFGAGRTDKTVRLFIPEFTDVWCFANRELFTLSHLPKDKKWQFEDEKVSKFAFNQAPVIGTVAVKGGIFWSEKMRGKIRAKVSDCKRLVFDLPQEPVALKVTLKMNEKPVTPDYYIADSQLYVDVPFTSQGKYPVEVNVGDNMMFAFMADVVKKQKR